MKVYLTPPKTMGRGIQRVAGAIARFAPEEVEVVAKLSDADLVIHHVAGVQNFESLSIDQIAQSIAKSGVAQAAVQYCFYTTEKPDLVWWFDHLWKYGPVWSYYDLGGLLKQKLNVHADATFYFAPLGVDPIFHATKPIPKDPIFLICTSGYVAETEGVLECVEAAKRVGGRVLHLGPSSLNLGPHVSYVEGVGDEVLAALYRNCRFVAGLRRIEGFELPAAEGACSGATPIMFDQPHYTRWFGSEDHGIAMYVPEVDPAIVTDAIEHVFRCGVPPLDRVTIGLAQRIFSWPRVVKGFWDRILANMQEKETSNGRERTDIPLSPAAVAEVPPLGVPRHAGFVLPQPGGGRGDRDQVGS